MSEGTEGGKDRKTDARVGRWLGCQINGWNEGREGRREEG